MTTLTISFEDFFHQEATAVDFSFKSDTDAFLFVAEIVNNISDLQQLRRIVINGVDYGLAILPKKEFGGWTDKQDKLDKTRGHEKN